MLKSKSLASYSNLNTENSVNMQIRKLMANLINLSNSAYPQNADQLMESYLKDFRQKNLKDILAWLAQNPNSQTCEKIMSNSYIHGNGFLKLVLAVGSDKEKLRLHFWNNCFNAEENLHCHRWTFRSLIIQGEIQSSTFEESTDIDAEDYDCFIYSKLKSIVETIPLGKIKLKAKKQSVRKSGDFYKMEQSTIHKIENILTKQASTLMFQNSPTKDWNLLMPGKQVKNPDLNPSKLQKSMFINLLNELIKTL